MSSTSPIPHPDSSGRIRLASMLESPRCWPCGSCQPLLDPCWCPHQHMGNFSSLGPPSGIGSIPAHPSQPPPLPLRFSCRPARDNGPDSQPSQQTDLMQPKALARQTMEIKDLVNLTRSGKWVGPYSTSPYSQTNMTVACLSATTLPKPVSTPTQCSPPLPPSREGCYSYHMPGQQHPSGPPQHVPTSWATITFPHPTPPPWAPDWKASGGAVILRGTASASLSSLRQPMHMP
ncbi:cat eye syndrome critical region protein 2 [Lates japonicus]|uniref:Cat eye syndrome critical region protein 2 n=1 Tax=Lates japonicus TaxID=270547 RepID=A0AAD3MVV1_LATJO|nr:cat eye syndrome critical region protein 2 [Lates japonicus]